MPQEGTSKAIILQLKINIFFLKKEGTRLAPGQKAESGALLNPSVGLFLSQWFLVRFLHYWIKNPHSLNAQTAESNKYRDLELNVGQFTFSRSQFP